MATTNYGWTTPALGSSNNPPADLASTAQQIDTTVADLHADTGWVTATGPGPNFSLSVAGHPLRHRVQGGWVIIEGIVNRTGGAWAEESLRIITLPTGLWPSRTRYLQPAIKGTNVVSIRVDPNGNLLLDPGYSTADPGNGFYQVYGSYPLG